MTEAATVSRSCAELRDFVATQRWFGGKGLDLIDAAVLDRADLGDRLAFILVETRYGNGSHDLYQLLARIEPGGTARFDALDDPAAVTRLVELAAAGATIPSELGASSSPRSGRCRARCAARGRAVELDR